jgi:hypothetical protein
LDQAKALDILKARDSLNQAKALDILDQAKALDIKSCFSVSVSYEFL